MYELFHQLFHRRHFWRHVSQSELAELYMSFMLRTLGLSMIGVFVPIYLYELGYSVAVIAFFYAFIYCMKIFFEPLAGHLIKLYGVKRLLEMSYMVLVVNLALTLGLSYVTVPLLLVALTSALSTATFYVSFDLEYSMIKSTKHEGKQLGALQITKKLAGALGPLIGGIIASFVSVQLTIVIAMLILLFAAIPLTLSGEIKRSRDMESVRITDYLKYRSRFWYFSGWGLVIIGNMAVWPLYIAVNIIQSNVYASLGLILSVSLLISIASASFFGRVVDDKKGKHLLNYTATGTFLTYLARPFIATYSGALFINVISEPLVSGLDMSFSKGFFDDVDDHGKHRLGFMIATRSYIHLARVLLLTLIGIVATYGDPILALQTGLVLVGGGALAVTTQQFKALR